MPLDELIICAVAGAIAAAVLMNWAVLEYLRLKRAGRVYRANLVLTPTFVVLSLLATGLGGLASDTDANLSALASGAVLLGIVFGGATAGFGERRADGDDDDGSDPGVDSDWGDGGDGGGA
jgi:hypothetical protein